MGKKFGKDCKLYRNTGTYGTPVWNEIPNVRDLTYKLEKDSSDLTTRGNGGWKAEGGTLKGLEVNFEMVYDPADDDVTALETSFDGDTTVEYAVMDGSIATAGNKGIRFSGEIFSFGQNQELTEGVKIPVTLKPAYAANAPSRHTVSA